MSVWKATKGLPYVPSAIVYKDQYILVKDGGLVTIYDTKSGNVHYQRAGRPRRTVLLLAGRRERPRVHRRRWTKGLHGDPADGRQTRAGRSESSA